VPETPKGIHLRADKVKEMFKQFLADNKDNENQIVIVSHSQFCRFLTFKDPRTAEEPYPYPKQNYTHLKNC
jgi:hypothetical protein